MKGPIDFDPNEEWPSTKTVAPSGENVLCVLDHIPFAIPKRTNKPTLKAGYRSIPYQWAFFAAERYSVPGRLGIAAPCWPDE